ncbi:MAG: anti-sigma factor [Rhizobacter sp.]|nr:anti-sigma factor [Rhizobacter sp.]
MAGAPDAVDPGPRAGAALARCLETYRITHCRTAKAGRAAALVGPACRLAGPDGLRDGISADGRAMVTRPLVEVSLEAQRALELWAVPASGAPRSLGLISATSATVLRRGRLLDGAAALAVSLEPTGGSPTGAPTGPILFVGKLNT